MLHLRYQYDIYSANYENLIITGDLDNEKNQEYMKRFQHASKTQKKNPQILTDNPQSFRSLCLVETGLYEFHKMTMIVRKHNIENVTSFVMIDFESISYLHYRVKTSIATEMDLKNSYKCFKALDNFAPR